MNWFYALNGQQAGPVDDAELDRLVQVGTIENTTLVWYSGMAQWQPYAEARRTVPALATAAFAAGSPARAVVGESQAQCSQCGTVLPADEIVQVDGLPICASCKPLLLQRMREGIPVQNAILNAPVYAGFWIRVGAAILDGLILIPVYLVLGLCMWFFTDLHNLDLARVQPGDIIRLTRSMLPISLITQFVLACYSAFCLNRFGGTPGKRICKLRVVRGGPGRERVSFLRGLGRFAAKMVPRSLPSLVLTGVIPPMAVSGLVWIIIIVDSIFIGIDGQRRALHDMACNTRVLSESPGR